MNSASPIPTGATKFPVCFSAASMKMVKTSKVVSSISIRTACALLVVAKGVVETLRSPVKSALTRKAPTMAPIICATTSRAARTIVTAPIRAMPRVT